MEPLPPDTDEAALHAAFRRLLEPIASLAVSKGVTHAALDEWLRAAFVTAAYQAHPDLPAHRRASRVSAATGLHRREVQRLLSAPRAMVRPTPSRAAEVFAHWRSEKAYRNADGTPRVIQRVGPPPSFEKLAQAVTRDIHPRTLLEELLRLKLAEHDPEHDTVALTLNAFVPSGDLSRMVGFLADNVGDHLRGAIDNVLEGGGRHFEQAVFAEGLGEASMDQLRGLVLQQWKLLTDALVPALEGMVEQDANTEAKGLPVQRFRLGLYTFADTSSPGAPPDGVPAADAGSDDRDDPPLAGRRASSTRVPAAGMPRAPIPTKGKKP